MVSSLDGFIAKEDGDVSWMRSMDVHEGGKVLTEQYITEFLDSIDCYVMGSKTYEHALELGWPYGNKPVIVLTTRELESDRSSVSFFNGELKHLFDTELKSYHNIWMVGGSALTKDFLKMGLADEIVISILPILLGQGLSFFDCIGKEISLHLKDSTAYNDGMVELTYAIR
ncbi:MAG: dihydrofolate reductase family protein [Cyclobacteriaceae bacterium]